MQLRLTLDEIRVLNEILQAGAAELCERLSREDSGAISALAAAQVARSINFDSDELDCVMDLVRHADEKIKQDIASEEDLELKRTLQRRQVVVRALFDKVSEACAML